jgi:hypothetical protein
MVLKTHYLSAFVNGKWQLSLSFLQIDTQIFYWIDKTSKITLKTFLSKLQDVLF